MITTYERGMFTERREASLRLLELKFGPLAIEIKRRVEGLPPDQMQQLQMDLIRAQSLKELHLDG